MKRRMILVTTIVVVLGLLGTGIFWYVRRNSGKRLLWRAEVSLRAERFDRALELAQDYLAENPDDPEGYLYLGRARMGQGTYEEARTAFNQARERSPMNVRVTLLLAETWAHPANRVLMSSVKVDELAAAAADFDKANAALDVWLDAASTAEPPPSAGDRLDIAEARGLNVVRAASCYRRTAMLADKEAQLSQAARNNEEADSWRQRLEEATRKAQDIEKQAIATLTLVVLEDPKRDKAANAVLGLCIRNEDTATLAKVRGAIETLDAGERPPLATMRLADYDLDVVRRSPYAKGADEKLHETAGILDALLARMTEDDPSRKAVTVKRAEVALQEGDAAHAIALCDSVINEKEPGQHQARLSRALAYMSRGEVAKAESELLSLRTYPPFSATVEFAYAQAAFASGKDELARASLRRIVRELDPGHAGALKGLTRYLLSKGFADQAFADAQALYNAHPDDPEAVELFVRTAVLTKQPGLAKTMLAKAAEDGADSPEMMWVVAGGLAQIGDRVGARAARQRVAAMNPGSIEELRAVCDALLSEGRVSEAEKRLFDAEKENPNHPLVHLMLGGLFEATGRSRQAIEEYGEAIALAPANDAARVRKAWALFESGDIEAAEDALAGLRLPSESAERLKRSILLRKSAVAGAPELVGPEGKGLDAARAYLSMGRPDECIRLCREALEETPDDADARLLLGRALLIQGNVDGCLAEWTTILKAQSGKIYIYQAMADILALTRNPGQVKAYLAAIEGANRDLIELTIGMLYDRRREFTNAAACYAAVTAHAEAGIDVVNGAKVLRAQALANDGSVDRAVTELDTITAPEIWRRQARWNKAQVLAAAGRIVEAEAVLQELIRDAIDTRDVSLLRQITSLYGRTGNAERALGIADEVLRLAPDDARSPLLKASLLLGTDRATESIAWFRKAIERQPGNLDTYRTLARVYDLKGQPAEALAVLDELGKTGDAGKVAAISERADMFQRWGLAARAVTCLEELSHLGYGSSPGVRFALGRAFALLGKKDKAREALEGIPKYAREYVAAQLFLGQLAETVDDKLAVFERLDAERPGDGAVLQQKMSVFLDANRPGDAARAYTDFVKKYGDVGRVSVQTSLMALRAMLLVDPGSSGARDLALRLMPMVSGPTLRRVVALLLMPVDPAKAEAVVGAVQQAGVGDALLGLAAARRVGADTKAWAARVRALPESSITTRVLTAVATNDLDAARNAMVEADMQSPIGRQAVSELIAFAGKDPERASAEATELIQASVAAELGLPMITKKITLGILDRRPESQWAAGLVAQNSPDEETYPRVLAKLRPTDCVTARMIQAARAEAADDFAKAAGIYRQVLEIEKGNTYVLRKLALAETLGGNLESAVAIQRDVWSKTGASTAANNIAYLLVQLYPNDREKLKEAETLIEAAMKDAPNVPAYLDTCGWIAHLRGDNTRALDMLRRAVKGLPGMVEPHAHLGVVELAAGNRNFARWHLEASVERARQITDAGDSLNSEQKQALALTEKTLSQMGNP